MQKSKYFISIAQSLHILWYFEIWCFLDNLRNISKFQMSLLYFPEIYPLMKRFIWKHFINLKCNVWSGYLWLSLLSFQNLYHETKLSLKLEFSSEIYCYVFSQGSRVETKNKWFTSQIQSILVNDATLMKRIQWEFWTIRYIMTLCIVFDKIPLAITIIKKDYRATKI